MKIVIYAYYDKDPRRRRVVVKDGRACGTEVCVPDHLGSDSWREDEDPPFQMKPEALVARALDMLAHDIAGGQPIAFPASTPAAIDLGTIGRDK